MSEHQDAEREGTPAEERPAGDFETSPSYEPSPSYGSSPNQAPPGEPPPGFAAMGSPPRYQRSPFIAGILSLFMPGMGNVYNGLVHRGLVTFAIAVTLFFSSHSLNDGSELALLVPSIFFVWIFSVVDAVRQATLINYGVTEADLPVANPVSKGSAGSIAAGLALLFVGTYGLLEAFGLDLSRLFDFWYLLPIALGGWLIVTGVKARRSEEVFEP